MDLRREFVLLAEQEGANVSGLCRRFGISRKTGYKWLARAGGGNEAVEDRSRRPRHSPRRTPAAMERAVLEVRSRHPSWGGSQDRPPPGRSRRDRRAGAVDGDGDPAASWRRPGPDRRWRSVPMLRAFAAERVVADGLQGPFCPGRGTLPSPDRARRLLALQPVPGGLRQRTRPDGARTPAHHLPPLRPAAVDPHRQRLALGRRPRNAVHPPRRLVAAPRHRLQPQPPPIIPRPSARTNASIAP